jgi:hypothetical protein
VIKQQILPELREKTGVDRQEKLPEILQHACDLPQYLLSVSHLFRSKK